MDAALHHGDYRILDLSGFKWELLTCICRLWCENLAALTYSHVSSGGLQVIRKHGGQ